MEEIPVYSSLPSVYEHPTELESRYKSLSSAFEKNFGAVPQLFARAPGRVNTIGEHIDYSGYGVLPMAIKHDTIVAVRRGGTKLVIANLDPKLYPTLEFDTDPRQEVDTQHHAWANYFVCAYKGVFELLEHKGIAAPEPSGLQVMIHGVVPTGSGLSSSAAFICSCMLAVLAAHGKAAGLHKSEVAEFAARAERYVGVQCGGMDQAISMMGMMGVAKMVDFNPVRASDVVLPAGATFVVANSLAVSNKAEGAHKRYNMRVVECRLAAMVLAVALGASKEKAASIKILMEVEPLVADKYGSADKAAQAVKEHLHGGYYTHEEIEGILGLQLSQIYASSPVSLKVLEVAHEAGGFKLHDRALHVYEESARVRQFKGICDGDAPAAEKLSQLGALMDASHASCSELYQCSCSELDALVKLAKEHGAIGARLTGAGWGGCTVSLVKEEDAAAFIAAIREKYYAPLLASGVAKEERMDDTLFASKPSSGAAVLHLEGLTDAKY